MKITEREAARTLFSTMLEFQKKVWVNIVSELEGFLEHSHVQLNSQGVKTEFLMASLALFLKVFAGKYDSEQAKRIRNHLIEFFALIKYGEEYQESIESYEQVYDEGLKANLPPMPHYSPLIPVLPQDEERKATEPPPVEVAYLFYQRLGLSETFDFANTGEKFVDPLTIMSIVDCLVRFSNATLQWWEETLASPYTIIP